MSLGFSPQCCDAEHYLEIGKTCATALADCWEPLRPIGAALYFSLPHRLGLPPEALIALNLLLVGASVALGWLALAALWPRSDRPTAVYRILALALVHAWFLWAGSWNALTDVPAAVLALLAIWLFILGVVQEGLGYPIGAGVALGLATITRAFYLYPALLAAGGWLLVAVVRRQRRLAALLFLLGAMAPAVGQVALTHSRVGVWSFIDPGKTEWAKRLHFKSRFSGYDTVLLPAPPHPVRQDAGSCFSRSSDVLDAIEKRDLTAVACVMLRRQYFHFGSYSRWGAIYLTSATERQFSLLYFFLNLLLAVLAAAAFAVSGRPRAMLVPGLLMAGILFQSSILTPEARFLMVIQVGLWSVALGALPTLAEVARRRWRARSAAARAGAA